MRSSAVMFRGIKSTIKAYRSNDVPAWSLWNGPKQLLFSFNGTDMDEGEKMLLEALQLLTEGGTQAALMLAVYDELKPGEKIKSNTPYDNSFNFSLWDDDAGESSPYKWAGRNKAVDDRLTAMEAILKKMCEEPEEEEDKKVSGIQGIIAGFLERPDIKSAISGKIVQFIDKITGTETAKQIAGIPGTENQPMTQEEQQEENAAFTEAWQKYPQDQQLKISKALRMLMASDSKLGDHLLGLAVMARDQPNKYKMALTFL